MRDFIYAALPLVIVGIALAVAAVIFAQNKRAKAEKPKDRNEDNL